MITSSFSPAGNENIVSKNDNKFIQSAGDEISLAIMISSSLSPAGTGNIVAIMITSSFSPAGTKYR
ncbi:MAG: hypothetical protein IPI04_03385 [Ignavibacteria bacterium]|nr:hypothetical protein [Ignavibacteria bacterium]